MGAQTQDRNKAEKYGPAVKLGTIKNKAVNESSGLVASRVSPGNYWTHNDSGDGPYLYACNGTGAAMGTWRVVGATAVDWEDIAAGPGPGHNKTYLYIGDIGDNNRTRPEVVIYRVAEPAMKPADRKSTKEKPRLTLTAEAIRLRYPDGSHDAETLLVHPTTGNLYIITKIALSNPAVYEAAAPLSTSSVITMKKLRELKLPSLLGGILTGGDISPDGRRVALCDYLQGYELVLPGEHKDFDEIWQQRITSFDLGKRSQGEAIAYRLDGRALLTTSEGKSPPLLQVVRQ